MQMQRACRLYPGKIGPAWEEFESSTAILAASLTKGLPLTGSPEPFHRRRANQKSLPPGAVFDLSTKWCAADDKKMRSGQRRRILSLSPVFIVLLFSPRFLWSESIGPWEFDGEKEGIRLYSRSRKTTSIREFRSTAIIKASLTNILKHIRNVREGKQWMADCVHSELLVRPGPNHYIAYYITAPPWPVQKRDAVLRIRVSHSPGSAVARISIRTVQPQRASLLQPTRPAFIRVRRFEGAVILKRIVAEKTLVEFTLMGDPGGSVPEFIINWGGGRIPMESIRGLRRLMEREEKETIRVR